MSQDQQLVDITFDSSPSNTTASNNNIHLSNTAVENILSEFSTAPTTTNNDNTKDGEKDLLSFSPSVPRAGSQE